MFNSESVGEFEKEVTVDIEEHVKDFTDNYKEREKEVKRLEKEIRRMLYPKGKSHEFTQDLYISEEEAKKIVDTIPQSVFDDAHISKEEIRHFLGLDFSRGRFYSKLEEVHEKEFPGHKGLLPSEERPGSGSWRITKETMVNLFNDPGLQKNYKDVYNVLIKHQNLLKNFTSGRLTSLIF